MVWRNWHAVEPERIAKVLGTSAENVRAMAESMELPPAVSIPPQQKTRGYFWMTMCRCNWHLLPIARPTGCGSCWAATPWLTRPNRCRRPSGRSVAQRLADLRRIVQDEIAIARKMFTLAHRDSCIGFEAASQYFYLPLDLVEKVFGCRLILDGMPLGQHE